MNWPRRAIIVLFLVVVSMPQAAQARWRGHGGHDRHWRGDVDIVIGAPLLGWPYYPYYDYPPRYYYDYPAPVFVTPPQPPVYIEQAPKQAAPPPQSYWYYCTNPQGYYPTVKECPGGWLKVVPQTQPTP